MEVDKQRLGILLDGMIRMLSAKQRGPMGEIMETLSEELGVTPAAIHKWRRGTFIPRLDAVTQLVQVGVQEAGMDRTWADEVLSLTGHPDRSGLLTRLFPSAVALRSPRAPIHNLPHLPHQRLYGREYELASVYERLGDQRQWIIPIAGMGGIGKTSLALEAAWQLVSDDGRMPARALAGDFDAVMYASASRRILDTRGATGRPLIALQRLDDLCAMIPETLALTSPAAIPSVNLAANLPADPLEERVRMVIRALRNAGRVLLIIDGLDALADDEMRTVLTFLRDVPANTKAIVTARFHEDLPWPIQLGALDSAALEKVLGDECAARLEPAGRSLAEPERERLIDAAEGNPLAVKWYLWKMIVEHVSAEEATSRTADFNEPLLEFLGDAYAQRSPKFSRKSSNGSSSSLPGHSVPSVALRTRPPARQAGSALIGMRKDE